MFRKWSKCAVAMMLVAVLALCAVSASAAKARFYLDDGKQSYHSEHLKLHIGSRNCKTSGNYIKVRTKAGGNKVVGHLEIADIFTLDEIDGHWARITVLYSPGTSPDSWAGLTGWVDADYIECPCSSGEYYANTPRLTYSLAVTNQDDTHVREETAKGSRSFAKLQAGEQVEVISEYTGKDRYLWYRVRYNNTVMGYIRSDALTITQANINEFAMQPQNPPEQEPAAPEPSAPWQHGQTEYVRATQENVTAFEENLVELSNLTAPYVGPDGYVSPGNKARVMEIAEQFAREKYEAGIISEYSVTDNSLFIRDAVTGITYNFYVPEEGVASGGFESTVSIYTFQPCNQNWGEQWQGGLAYVDESARLLSEAVERCVFPEPENNRNDSQVPYNIFDTFGPNQIIIWHGHGGYADELGPFIATGTKSNIGFKIDHWDDYVNNRLTDCSSISGDLSNVRVGVTEAYIRYYCHDMSGTFIYMGICESGRDSRLADAFRSKGAAAYIGNSKTIRTTYTTSMQVDIIALLGTVNPATHDYYMLNDALIQAKFHFGDDDGHGVYPIIFFGGDYQASVNSQDTWITAYRTFVMSKAYDQIGYPEYLPDKYDIVAMADGTDRLVETNYDADPIWFTLYDMNYDDVPELIIFNGYGYMAGNYCHVYTFRNRKLKYLGTMGRRDLMWEYSLNRDLPGLVMTDGNGGEYSTDYWYIGSNGQLCCETIESISYSESETEEPIITRVTNNDELYNWYKSNTFKALNHWDYATIDRNGWQAFVLNFWPVR